MRATRGPGKTRDKSAKPHLHFDDLSQVRSAVSGSVPTRYGSSIEIRSIVLRIPHVIVAALVLSIWVRANEGGVIRTYP